MQTNPPEQHGHAISENEALPLPALILRGGVGGLLMGLANLVPGISGGTMLLAAGVYPTFVSAIADISRVRVRARELLTLLTIVISAALAILLLAGTMQRLVIEQRWIMYSLFIGLTLGGVPLVWRLARPATPALWVAAAVSFALMVVMAFVGADGGGGDAGWLMLLLAGLAGASAMILPGVSGGYLLLLLGQYETILGAIDTLKTGLLGVDGSGMDTALVLESMRVVVPVGIGVVVGVVGVSNLIKWLLERYEKPTLGMLLGLLVGAVVGLYPFQQPVLERATPPSATAAATPDATAGSDAAGGDVAGTDGPTLEELEDAPLEPFTPTPLQVAGAVGLVIVGFGATLLVDRVGS